MRIWTKHKITNMSCTHKFLALQINLIYKKYDTHHMWEAQSCWGGRLWDGANDVCFNRRLLSQPLTTPPPHRIYHLSCNTSKNNISYHHRNSQCHFLVLPSFIAYFLSLTNLITFNCQYTMYVRNFVYWSLLIIHSF